MVRVVLRSEGLGLGLGLRPEEGLSYVARGWLGVANA